MALESVWTLIGVKNSLPPPEFESRAICKVEGRYHRFIYRLSLLPPILRYHPSSAFSQKHLSNVRHCDYTEVRMLFPWIDVRMLFPWIDVRILFPWTDVRMLFPWIDVRIVPDAVPFPLQPLPHIPLQSSGKSVHTN